MKRLGDAIPPFRYLTVFEGGLVQPGLSQLGRNILVPQILVVIPI